MTKKAIVLLSGGMDSTTCIAIAKDQDYDIYALSFNYQQRHIAELKASQQVAKHFGCKAHRIIELPIHLFGSSALTDPDIDVPEYQGDGKIPITYVPARNLIFLSIALGWAEVLGINDIFMGTSAIDYSGYPDCRPEFFESFSQTATLATKAGVEGQRLQICTPLIHLSKAETILMGQRLGVDYQMTVSCYQADAHGCACGICDSCVLRKNGFEQANLPDQTRYQSID